MVAPLTPKPTRKAEALTKAPSTIVSRHEEDVALNFVVYECRCDERLKTKAEESTRLVYTGLLVELEHLKIKRCL